MGLTSANSPLEFSFRTRQANWLFLKNNSKKVHNVVIIGGGIVGAGILREMVIRSIPNVVLIEKNDFASGTSHASSKLIHAGIRYLELAWNHFKKGEWGSAWQNFRFVTSASRERQRLNRMAPSLIKPKPIYVVLGETDGRSPLSVWAGVWLYYFIQLLQGQFYPPPRMVLRRNAIRWVAPELDPKKVKAIFSFWDSETDDARLVIENLQSANRNGGKALNYVELLSCKKENSHWSLTLKNNRSNEIISVLSKLVINATGAWVDEVRKRAGQPITDPLVDRVEGAHLDVYPALTKESYYVTAGDGRLVFVLNRNEDGINYTRIGTTERSLLPTESSDHVRANNEEIEYLKNIVQDYFPNVSVTMENIYRVDSGIRPLTAQTSKDAFQKSREHRIVEKDGLVHIVGVKLTDYRRVAMELIKKINWMQYDIEVRKMDPDLLVSLRESDSPELYAERDPLEFINKTMVITWDDYFDRRQGLAPRVWAQKNPEKLNHFFDVMKEEMKWEQKK